MYNINTLRRWEFFFKIEKKNEKRTKWSREARATSLADDPGSEGSKTQRRAQVGTKNLPTVTTAKVVE